jgi:hypothetical protein
MKDVTTFATSTGCDCITPEHPQPVLGLVVNKMILMAKKLAKRANTTMALIYGCMPEITQIAKNTSNHGKNLLK